MNTKSKQRTPAKREQRTPDDPEQSKRFIQSAVEAEADETEKGADRAFKNVVKPQPPKKG